ncbi:MAG: MBL fold metallo-hydrolase [Acidimicrobiia bacterium]
MDATWDELGTGVFRRRYASLDLNVGLVLGERGALIIDTRASHGQARELLSELRRVTALPVKWVVNTHWHWDHTFGNAIFAGVPVYGHERCRERLLSEGAAAKLDAIGWVGEEHRAAIEEVEITPPRLLLADSLSIDLGTRTVELRHHGLAHTDNDVVVAVPDADVLFAGDVLENGAPPYMGDGYPLAWPDTVAAFAPQSGVVVPGHGDVMTPGQVATQLADLRVVAEMCAASLEGAEYDAGSGPFPPDTMETAWDRAVAEAQISP